MFSTPSKRIVHFEPQRNGRYRMFSVWTRHRLCPLLKGLKLLREITPSCITSFGFKPFPDDKNLIWSKLKAFAEDKIKIIIISFFHRVEDIVGQEENAGYQHFLLLPQCFVKASFPDVSKGVSKGIILWEWKNTILNNCIRENFL